MSVVVVLGRAVLALIFVVAGLAKLADRAGSRQALRDFGVLHCLPRPWAPSCPWPNWPWRWHCFFPPRPGGGAWERWLCCSSWQASPSTWRVGDSRTATVSANCIRLLLAGLP